jgi:hypothetical protein
MELVMNAFFLNAALEAMRQHSRSGMTRRCHFRLSPLRVISSLRKQLVTRFSI